MWDTSLSTPEEVQLRFGEQSLSIFRVGASNQRTQLTCSEKKYEDNWLRYITPCILVEVYGRFGGTWCFEDRDSTFLRNVSKFKLLRPRRHKFHILLLSYLIYQLINTSIIIFMTR